MRERQITSNPRLLEVARDESGVKARVTEAAARHQTANAAVGRIIAAAIAMGPGRAAIRRDGGFASRPRGSDVIAAAEAVAAVAEANRQAAGGSGAAATIEPMEIVSATDMEEGKSLL